MISPPKRDAKPRPRPPEPAPALTVPMEPPAQEASRESRTRARREINSAELFAGSREIGIRHAHEIYTLRRTSKGKLILTK